MTAGVAIVSIDFSDLLATLRVFLPSNTAALTADFASHRSIECCSLRSKMQSCLTRRRQIIYHLLTSYIVHDAFACAGRALGGNRVPFREKFELLGRFA